MYQNAPSQGVPSGATTSARPLEKPKFPAFLGIGCHRPNPLP